MLGKECDFQTKFRAAVYGMNIAHHAEALGVGAQLSVCTFGTYLHSRIGINLKLAHKGSNEYGGPAPHLVLVLHFPPSPATKYLHMQNLQQPSVGKMEGICILSLSCFPVTATGKM
jgi:hypothetical protein